MATAPLPSVRAVSPLKEMGAYEALWARAETTFQSLADLFRENPGVRPSDLVDDYESKYFLDLAQQLLRKAGVHEFGVRVHRAGEYPQRLRDAEDPVELLYFRGWWNLVEAPSVAVVGTRRPSAEGLKRTAKLVKHLVSDGFTIVSGLAQGIDTAAHTTAMKLGGRTISVIGTPLTHVYPRENAELQEQIARDFLLVSQVPVYRYSKQDYRRNRMFFPERNKTMSALTEGTIIVEAGQTSGTLIQARAALHQRRKLFVLDSCFRDASLHWPSQLERQGAIRVRDYEDIRRHLTANAHQAR